VPPLAQLAMRGFWKQPQHLDSWSGFDPSQTLESAFDVPDAFGLDDATLLEALSLQVARWSVMQREFCYESRNPPQGCRARRFLARGA